MVRQPTSAGKVKKSHLSDNDYRLVVDWLSVPKNLASVFGVSGKTTVGKPPLRRAQGLNALAAYLKAKTNGRIVADTRSMVGRLDTYKKKLRTALIKQQQTGFGLSAEEVAAGVTIEQKLNKACPHFYRMKALFHADPTVAPRVTRDSLVDTSSEGIGNKSDHESDNEGDANNVAPSLATHRCSSSSSASQPSIPVSDDHLPCPSQSPPALPSQVPLWAESAPLREGLHMEENQVSEDEGMQNMPEATPGPSCRRSISRASDKRKAPPSLHAPQPKKHGSLFQSFSDAARLRLDGDKAAKELQLNFDREKWEHEKKQIQEETQAKLNLEQRKLDLEERKFDIEMRERALDRASKEKEAKKAVMMLALEKGQSAEEIAKLLQFL